MTNQEEKEMQLTVPYIMHEAAQARSERTIRRLIVALIVSIILLFATNAIWLIYNSQYDYSTSDITVGTDGEGDANFIGQDGEINNGIYQSGNEDENTPSRCERQENS